MSITLKQHGTEGRWIMEITNEVWEFENLDSLIAEQISITIKKDKYGRIDKRKIEGF